VCTTSKSEQPEHFLIQTRAPRTTAEPPPPKAGKVLLVDDDFAISEAIADFLEEEGFSVASASNGIDALNQLRCGLRVDVIVLDVIMPLMDGWDFRVEQLADPALRQTPVVVISASGFTGATIRERFHAYDALSKPIELEHFLQTLKDVCATSDAGPTSSPTGA
jgi:CheY-like chemotaxis protein